MNNNAAIIISPDGTEQLLKLKEETFHYQLFERINNEVIPGILDDLTIDPRAYSGYNLAVITASKDYTIIMKWNLNKRSKDVILAIPSELTKNQYDRVNEILKELKDIAVYLFVCEKPNELDHVFITPKTSYIMTYQEDKSLEKIKEISIIEYKINNIKK